MKKAFSIIALIALFSASTIFARESYIIPPDDGDGGGGAGYSKDCVYTAQSSTTEKVECKSTGTQCNTVFHCMKTE